MDFTNSNLYYNSDLSDFINLNKNKNVNLITYNMHGFNQGSVLLNNICNSVVSPDLICLQENWLTPGNLYKV